LIDLHPPSEAEMDHLRQMAAWYLNGEVCPKTGVVKCNESHAWV